MKKPASTKIRTIEDRVLGSLNDIFNGINLVAHLFNVSKCNALLDLGNVKGDFVILPTSKLVAERGGLVPASVLAIKSTNDVIEQAISSQVCMKICII